MTAGGLYHVKYRDLVEYYAKYVGEKCKYTVFANRVNYLGYILDKAIEPGEYKKGKKHTTEIKEEGRICTKCLEFKTRDKFASTKETTTKRTPDCLLCRQIKKKEYRERTGRTKDMEYRKSKRKLSIGEKIAFLNPVFVDGIPREDIWIVKEYQYHKGYMLQSIHDKSYKRLDTNDNQKTNTNCKRFYKIVE